MPQRLGLVYTFLPPKDSDCVPLLLPGPSWGCPTVALGVREEGVAEGVSAMLGGLHSGRVWLFWSDC